MAGVAQYLRGGAFQHHFTGIHDCHAVANTRDRAQIMADIDHGHARLAGKVAQKFEDMCLRRHIQTGCRLIEQQCFRLARQRHRDGDPLLLSAR